MTTYEVHPDHRDAQPTLVGAATLAVGEIGPWLGRTYHAVAEVLRERGSRPAGPPFARFHHVSNDRFEVEAGFPVSEAVEGIGDVRASALPGGPVAATTHIGPYDAMAPAYDALTSWITEHDGEPVGDAWETYYSDPGEQPDPATWRTEITQPYRTA